MGPLFASRADGRHFRPAARCQRDRNPRPRGASRYTLLLATLAFALNPGALSESAEGVASTSVKLASSPPRGPSFAVYRMLGNDMWPLQGVGQMRKNTAYALAHEAPPPPNISVFWVVNRIVNATERALLVSTLKAAGRGADVLHVSPPLAAMHCLESDHARSLFAQAQNAVRNAMLEHASANGYEWAIPLDGNQFLPADFYGTMRRVFVEADSERRAAVLIPMLRVHAEQDAAVLNERADFRTIADAHFTEENKFHISEPQLAFHVERSAARKARFDTGAAYGNANKARLVGGLCRLTGKGKSVQEAASCCELVQWRKKQSGEARYTGGELDLRRHVEMVRNARGSEGKSSDARSKDVRSEVLELAMQLGEKCGATVRLHNYPAVENDVGVDQRKIATSVMTRSKYRYKAKKFLVKYIESYLGHTTKPDVSACEGLSTRIELVKEDPNDVTEAQASALLKEMEIKREQIEHERVSAEKIAASEKDAEFTDQPGRGATLEVPEETAKAVEDSEAEGETRSSAEGGSGEPAGMSSASSAHLAREKGVVNVAASPATRMRARALGAVIDGGAQEQGGRRVDAARRGHSTTDTDNGARTSSEERWTLLGAGAAGLLGVQAIIVGFFIAARRVRAKRKGKA